MRWPLDSFFISKEYSEAHPALDIAAPEGAPIKAPEDGKIEAVNNNEKAYYGGKYVILRGKSGLRHYLGHNKNNHVSVGQTVTEGQHIADVGKTGFAIPSENIAAPSGPHIHHQVSNQKTVRFRDYVTSLDIVKEEDMGRISSIHEERQLKTVALHREVKDSELGGELGKSYKQALDGIYNSKEYQSQNHILKVAYPEALEKAGKYVEADRDLKVAEKALGEEKTARKVAEMNAQLAAEDVKRLQAQLTDELSKKGGVMKNLGQYNKFWIALGAALVVLGTGLGDAALSAEEFMAAGAAFLGALGVIAVPNKDKK